MLISFLCLISFLTGSSNNIAFKIFGLFISFLNGLLYCINSCDISSLKNGRSIFFDVDFGTFSGFCFIFSIKIISGNFNSLLSKYFSLFLSSSDGNFCSLIIFSFSIIFFISLISFSLSSISFSFLMLSNSLFLESFLSCTLSSLSNSDWSLSSLDLSLFISGFSSFNSSFSFCLFLNLVLLSSNFFSSSSGILTLFSSIFSIIFKSGN